MGKKKVHRKTNRLQEGGTSSSGEDQEHQRTMDIINRLSQKYLKASIKSDSEEQDSRRRSRRLTKSEPEGHAYDGDVETSTEDTSPSDMSQTSIDMYEFDDAAEQSLRLVLFPDDNNVKQKKNKKSRSKPEKSVKENKVKKVEKGQDQKKKPTERLSKKRPLETKNSEQTSSQSVKHRKLSPVRKGSIDKKTKQISSSIVSSVSTIARDSISFSKDRTSTGSSFADSGVFLSPPLRRSRRSTDTSISTPTAVASTPSETKSSRSTADDSNCFGFDSMLAPSPMLSPVERVTPVTDGELRQRPIPMDTGSPRLKTPLAAKTYANIIEPFSGVKKFIKSDTVFTDSQPAVNEPKKKKVPTATLR